ncbi:MAG: hypothetical protein LBR83_07530 [Clostridiales bacterium]|nr:hypothetical protein [Clostridiales bacterium]
MLNGKNFGNYMVSACFLIIIFSLGTYFLFTEKAAFSDAENRELAPAPRLTDENGSINTRFYYDLETYYTDRFPFRNGFLGVNRTLQTAFALKPPGFDGEVTFVTVESNDGQGKSGAPESPQSMEDTTQNTSVGARDEEVGAAEGSAEVPADTGEVPFDFTSLPIIGDRTFELYVYHEPRVREFADAVNNLALACKVPTYVLLSPASSELYLPEKYRAPENNQKPAFDLLKTLITEAEYIDLYDSFQNAKDKEYLYFRTDHHWTADGAYLAYENFCKATGQNPVSRSEMESGRRDGFLGSLYKQVSQSAGSERLSGSPDFIRYYFPVYETEAYNYANAGMLLGSRREVLLPDYEKDTNLYNIFFGGDMELMRMESAVGNGKSIMVARDSYGHAFLPFLANHYETVYAVEPRYFESFDLANFIAENQIDELLIMGYSFPMTGAYWLNWPQELAKLY